jgi:hypothetical protein
MDLICFRVCPFAFAELLSLQSTDMPIIFSKQGEGKRGECRVCVVNEVEILCQMLFGATLINEQKLKSPPLRSLAADDNFSSFYLSLVINAKFF